MTLILGFRKIEEAGEIFVVELVARGKFSDSLKYLSERFLRECSRPSEKYAGVNRSQRNRQVENTYAEAKRSQRGGLNKIDATAPVGYIRRHGGQPNSRTSTHTTQNQTNEVKINLRLTCVR